MFFSEPLVETFRKLSVKRFQVYLDTGEYPEGRFNKVWDMLDWIDKQKV